MLDDTEYTHERPKLRLWTLFSSIAHWYSVNFVFDPTNDYWEEIPDDCLKKSLSALQFQISNTLEIAVERVPDSKFEQSHLNAAEMAISSIKQVRIGQVMDCKVQFLSYTLISIMNVRTMAIKN